MVDSCESGSEALAVQKLSIDIRLHRSLVVEGHVSDFLQEGL